jgi:hypothetical protein
MLAGLRQRLRASLSRQAVRELLHAVFCPFVGQRAVLLIVAYFASFFVTLEFVAWRALPHVPFFDGWLRWDGYRSYDFLKLIVSNYLPRSGADRETVR